MDVRQQYTAKSKNIMVYVVAEMYFKWLQNAKAFRIQTNVKT